MGYRGEVYVDTSAVGPIRKRRTTSAAVDADIARRFASMSGQPAATSYSETIAGRFLIFSSTCWISGIFLTERSGRAAGFRVRTE